jgi:hypothetical protein
MPPGEVVTKGALAGPIIPGAIPLNFFAIFTNNSINPALEQKIHRRFVAWNGHSGSLNRTAILGRGDDG